MENFLFSFNARELKKSWETKKMIFSNPGSELDNFSPWVHATLRVRALKWHWAFFGRPFFTSRSYSKALSEFLSNPFSTQSLKVKKERESIGRKAKNIYPSRFSL